MTKLVLLEDASPLAYVLSEKDGWPLVTGLIDHRFKTDSYVGGPHVEYNELPGFHLEILRPGALKSGQFMLSQGRIRNPWTGWSVPENKFWRWSSFEQANPPQPNPWAPGGQPLHAVWTRTWFPLIEEIRYRGHGGMIVLAPLGTHADTGRAIGGLHLGEYIVRLASTIHNRGSLKDPAARLEAKQQWSDRRLELLTAIRTIADLSKIDGAVVATHALEIRAVGVRLLDGKERLPFRTSEGEHPKTPEDYTRGHGTRHSSAADYCATHPNTTALVVSQDGDVSIVASFDDHWTVLTPWLAG